MLRVLSTLTHLVPTVGKYLAFLVLLLNAGSLPGVWHLRVFSSAISFQLQLGLLQLRTFFWCRADQQKAVQAWYEKRLPIGEHPFRWSMRCTSWVSIDDADFNMHMSNSSYAKCLDSLRLPLAKLPNLFRAGAWIPLAATHYHFVREIPIFARYEIRTTIGAWDDKWIWTIHRFVTPSKKSKSKPKYAIESTPSHADSITTPALAGTTPNVNGLENSGAKMNGYASTHTNDGTATPEAIGRTLLAAAVREEEPEGGVLCTIVVSQLCFKQGRITIPPAVVLASNGFCAPPPSPSSPSSGNLQKQSSSDATSSHFTASIRALSTPTAGGSPRRALAAFYAGGWRTVPPAERWWDHALSGLDAELRERLRLFGEEGLKGGLGAVRAMR
ncbi:hypothetical protein C8J57DRAFT_1241247 [Mycena rebaudengoi]|nr:hypothetical protein C8J57DRAFT_1241247 [Mycena rebaudengoi]